MSAGAFADFLCDSLRALGPVAARRMFSGAGLFCDGLMFGLIVDDTLYLKSDADGAHAFAAEGEAPFVYESKGRRVSLGYWRAPERLLDDPDELLEWGRRALSVARRAAASRGRSKPAGTARKGAAGTTPASPRQAGATSAAGAKKSAGPRAGRRPR